MFSCVRACFLVLGLNQIILTWIFFCVFNLIHSPISCAYSKYSNIVKAFRCQPYEKSVTPVKLSTSCQQVVSKLLTTLAKQCEHLFADFIKNVSVFRAHGPTGSETSQLGRGPIRSIVEGAIEAKRRAYRIQGMVWSGVNGGVTEGWH